jgi:hypothetical protein
MANGYCWPNMVAHIRRCNKHLHTKKIAHDAATTGRQNVSCVNGLYLLIYQMKEDKHSLLSNRIIISTFCSFTGQTFWQKIINYPAIANA